MVERALLGIDGNCAFALVGIDLVQGEAEFVEIPYGRVFPEYQARRMAAFAAHQKLKDRLGITILPYELGPGLEY